jgi:hypothetical protein
MDRTYWLKQTPDKPLFPELLWSRPENKSQAGKLLIIGGNLHGFSAPATAFAEAGKAGIGTVRILLPDALKKTVGRLLENTKYAPSTPSGSFARNSLAQMLELAAWADGVLLAGDLGRNSETAIVLESLAKKYTGPLILSKDAADYFSATNTAQELATRGDTTAVLSLAQLQKLAVDVRFKKPFTFSMDLIQLVERLHAFTSNYSIEVITKHRDTIFVAAAGKVSTTKLSKEMEIWRVKTAAHAAVSRIHFPDKPFEATTTYISYFEY